MKIDVLICVHSTDDYHDKLLGRALESLVSQTYTDFKVIAVLDQCWEFTRSVFDNYAKVLDIRIFERPHKQGLAMAKNYGISKSDADWLTYLDADDAWLPSKLETQVEFIKKHPEFDIVGTQAWDVYNPGEDNEEVRENCFLVGQYQSHAQIAARLPHENVVCHGSVIVKMSVLVALGGYNTSREHLGREDWQIWTSALESGYLFYNIPERLVLYSMGTSVPR